MLHFPLHVAILLTVEGSSQFIIWNITNQYSNWQYNWILPLGYAPYYYNQTSWIQSLQTNISAFDDLFKPELLDYYDYNVNLTALSKINASTDSGSDKAYAVYTDLYQGLSTFVFSAFDVEVPDDVLESATTSSEVVTALDDVFVTVFLYFLIAGGFFLMILGTMYWFGKNNKSKWEYMSIGVRMLVGLGVTLLSTSILTNDGWNLFVSPWMLPFMMLAYFLGKLQIRVQRRFLLIFAVIALDNILVWHSNKTIAHALEYHKTRSVSQDESV